MSSGLIRDIAATAVKETKVYEDRKRFWLPRNCKGELSSYFWIYPDIDPYMFSTDTDFRFERTDSELRTRV